jgi:hypothetical protein
MTQAVRNGFTTDAMGKARTKLGALIKTLVGELAAAN